MKGYDFQGPAVELGALVREDGTADAAEQIRIPLAMLNRHGLVAGATGTGKTKTLQVLAEQLSAQGVPVFLADVKGDLSGLAAPGEPSDRVTARAAQVGQAWRPAACPVEFLSLGGQGAGVPVRATMTAFGPVLLAKVLDLNETQESSLGLVFHFADHNGMPLLDLKDLIAVIRYLTATPEALRGIGGLSAATAGVILRALTGFEAQGAEAFFGEPEFDVRDLLRVTGDGQGVVSVLELPAVRDRPLLFSTFLMWLLADLFQVLPEVGDPDRPTLVFFFDEAHLLFDGASAEFRRSIVQTVRLIRSKGVGVFFVTQTPDDVPAEVLAQLGARVQHALRAFTPRDAKALKATVSTFPRSGYDLARLLAELAIGDAVVTVLSETGVPTPVAWTRLRAPRTLMAAAAPEVVAGVVAASPLSRKYGTAVDRRSAYEILAARLAEQQPAAPPARPAPEARSGRAGTEPEGRRSVLDNVLESKEFRSLARSAASALGREITRSIFGTARRGRR
ncbi:ATPase [Sphaerisporangium rufum]|uniref:ATPase n=1 Tax=Sphaerisporangium rufum TaxID=1381558 RepID=A0A919QZL2_9ACTN|nr:helicase HerA-like domain-containing protein [Sphaerisporangium rufum]GII77079.1 ATPase [Sphaerisporangium rufum]